MRKYYVIPGNPIALARVRVSNGKFYDSQKHTKVLWGIFLGNQHEGCYFEGPLELDVIFHMPIPKSLRGKKREAALNQYHIFTPDTDNLIKFVCDASQGIAYANDCIIAKMSVEKVYSEDPRTEFILTELKEKRVPRKINL